jgi:hypothetical protein
MKLRMNRIGIWIISALLVVIVALGWLWWDQHSVHKTKPQQALLKVESVHTVKDNYDVIVAGTDPEGITAAISAARNGLKVLLVDGRNREILGGLITNGWLNSLDLNKSPEKSLISGKNIYLDKGIFQEWMDQMEGTSVDTHTAANVFYEMVRKEPNIDLLLRLQDFKPVMEVTSTGKTVVGLTLVKPDGSQQIVRAKSVIDATQDADVAAAAGVPFTVGREDIGDPKSQMAVTLVFQLSGVTPKVWNSLRKHQGTGSDATSISGFGEMKEYTSTNKERVRMRGLNMGRQNDNTVLINAMQIFGVDPLNPKSVQEGIEIGKQEAPHVVDYMKKNFNEFKDVKLVGTAPELYVRESRHIEGEYRLTMADLMENRDYWDAIAYGSYEVDIQSTQYTDPGNVMMKPIQYGVPFRTLVPLQVDGLLVVGRSASFNSVPAGSARVIPLGMATGEAAGAAAKIAIDKHESFRQLSQSKDDITALRAKLIQQKMDLKMNTFNPPEYTKHKAFPGLKAAVSMLLTSGGYSNKTWDLDNKTNAQSFVYRMLNVRMAHQNAFKGIPNAALQGISDPAKVPLTLDQAAFTLCVSMGLATTKEKAAADLQAHGWLNKETTQLINDPSNLTNGESFLLIRDIVDYYAGVKYP